MGNLVPLRPSEALALLQQVDGEEDIKEQQESSTLWFGLKLSNVGLLIAEDCSKELLEPPQICPVPFTPAWLIGFINVRGQVTPVVDLEEFFELRDKEAVNSESNSPMIANGDNSNSIAIDSEKIPNSNANLSLASADPTQLANAQRNSVSAYQPLSYLLRFEQGAESFAVRIAHFPLKLELFSSNKVTKSYPLPDSLLSCTRDIYYQEQIWCEWDLEAFKRRVSQMLKDR